MKRKSLPSKTPKKLLRGIKEDFEFPIFKTKIKGISHSFDLSDPKERKKYFELKAGPEIKKLKSYLKRNTFIAYLLGKKNSGKGTYAKLFGEIMGEDRVLHISIGDIVRGVEAELKNKKKKEALLKFLKKNYRGYISLDETLKTFSLRSTKTLLPTEFILTLVKREIDKHPKKTLFIDGFPRDLDQVSYSLLFRDLVDHRYDPDIFILIDVPEVVIDKRIRYRVICPICQTPRNLKVQPAKEVRYDEKNQEFYFVCDNPKCENARMVKKEGDELGIEPIKQRLKLDEKLMRQTFSLYGIPKILLRNSLPVKVANQYVDTYEITPEYSYNYDPKSKKVAVEEKSWAIRDDRGVLSYSLLPPPIVVSMIKQMVRILHL